MTEKYRNIGYLHDYVREHDKLLEVASFAEALINPKDLESSGLWLKKLKISLDELKKLQSQKHG